MSEFEHAAVTAIVGESLLAADVKRQLPFVSVSSRAHDGEEWCVTLEVRGGAPMIIPRDAECFADLEVANAGVVVARLVIEEGCVRSLRFEVPAIRWPANPHLIGIAQCPEP